MNFEQLFMAFLNGNRDLIPEFMRVEMIKQVMGAKKIVVAYIKGETTCPFCRRFGIIDCNQVRIEVTKGNTKYMICKKCGCQFTGIAPEEEKPKEIETGKKEKKKKPKRRKK